MVGNLLIRGMLVGILAGLLAFGVAKIFGEPQVDSAIAFEDHQHQMSGEAPEPELVSRAVQSGSGLLIGVVTTGVALGGIFSLVFAFAYGRIGRFGARATAALIAAASFFAVALVPQLKYPANPPSVGNPETIGSRTALYFTMIALSILILTAAIGTGRRLVDRHGGWNAALIAGAAYLVAMAVAMLVLPTVNEVPAEFSAVVLWNFRLAALAIQATLWATLGLVFGAVAERYLNNAAGHGIAARHA